MTITFYTNTSENISLDKDLTEITTMTGELKAETSIIDPNIIIAGDLSDFTSCNYMYIPEFGRYYFIKNIRSIRAGLVEITAHVDVLTSFKDEIRANSGIMKRNEYAYNLYLNDGSMKAYQDRYVDTINFPDGFTGYSYILLLAG